MTDDGWVCTVVVSFEPGERCPLLLLGVRDELTDRPWRPPASHWPGSPLVGGLDEQAGGTWLAVHPRLPRVSCLLNGRGLPAHPSNGGASAPPNPPDKTARRSRGELPLRAAADGAQVLKELAEDGVSLARYDPFHLVVADIGSLWLLSWDGERVMNGDLPPGTRVLVNSGHAYPANPVTEPKAAYFGPKFAGSRPSGDPALPVARAWEPWLTLAAGDGLDPGDPRAIIARRVMPDGRQWGTTSLTLIALAADGRVRYDFQSRADGDTQWHPVELSLRHEQPPDQVREPVGPDVFRGRVEFVQRPPARRADPVVDVHRGHVAKRASLDGHPGEEEALVLPDDAIAVPHRDPAVVYRAVPHGHVVPAGLFCKLAPRPGVVVLAGLEPAAWRRPVPPVGRQVVVPEQQHPVRGIKHDHPARQPQGMLSFCHGVC
jgi:hypothetical protein